MFDLFVSGIRAYNQVGLFIGAAICLGIGGLLLGNALYWRMHCVRANGTIIGVMVRSGTFAPVYRYASPDGQSHVAKSNIGSSVARGKETGRVVRLLISPHDRSDARQAGDHWMEIIGLLFIAPGAWLGYTAITAFPVTPMTWFMAIGMALYLAERAIGIFVRKGPHMSIAEWMALIRSGAAAPIDLSNVKPIESVVPEATLKKSWRGQLASQKKYAPLIGILAVVLVCVGAYLGARLFHLETEGLRAPGEVVSLTDVNSSGDSSTYHAIIEFRTAEGTVVEFRDDAGGNPPLLRPGQVVTVLYLAGDPGRGPMVDRGVALNWMLPVILFAIAAFVAWLIGIMLWDGAGNAQSKAIGTPMKMPSA